MQPRRNRIRRHRGTLWLAPALGLALLAGLTGPAELAGPSRDQLVAAEPGTPAPLTSVRADATIAGVKGGSARVDLAIRRTAGTLQGTLNFDDSRAGRVANGTVAPESVVRSGVNGASGTARGYLVERVNGRPVRTSAVLSWSVDDLSAVSTAPDRVTLAVIGRPDLTYSGDVMSGDVVVLPSASSLPGGMVTIDAGREPTSRLAVTVRIQATGAPRQMRLANGPDPTRAAWRNFAAVVPWTLSRGDGVKTVSVQLRNARGTSGILVDEVVLDTRAPVIADSTGNVEAAPNSTVVIESSVTDPNLASVSLVSRPVGATSWTAQPMATDGVGPWRATVPVATTDLQYYVQASDAAGNRASDPVAAPSISYRIRVSAASGDITAPSGTVVIAGGDAFTGAPRVTLSLNATDNVGVMSMRIADGPDPSAAPWQAFATTATWTLPARQGPATVSAQFRDAAGNISVAALDDIVLDSIAPTGTLAIAGGATSTAQQAVALALEAADAGGVSQMRLADGSDPSGAAWEPFEPIRNWALPAGDGPRPISVQFRDRAGNVSAVVTATITLAVPPTGSIAIAGGAAVVSSRVVALSLPATDNVGVAQVRLANEAAPSTADWEPYAPAREWTLSVGDGPKTVRAQFRDAAGNESPVYSAEVLLDTLAPTARIVLGEGAATTATREITVHVSATDGAAPRELRIADGPDPSVAAWVLYSAAQAWTLPAGDGPKVVSAQLRDAAGNTSAVVSETVLLDTTAPSIGGSTGNTSAEQLGSVTLRATVTDAGSGVAGVTAYYRAGTSGDFATAALAAGPGGSYTATLSGPGLSADLQYYLQATDRAGNRRSDPSSGTYAISVTAPQPVLSALRSTEPADGESNVSVAREVTLRFSAPLVEASVLDGGITLRGPAGELPARLNVAPDGRVVTVFPRDQLPLGARIEVAVDGSALRGADGQAVDADGDGQPGGAGRIRFTTVALSSTPGTKACGRVFASDPAGGGAANTPLNGVTVSVQGQAEMRTTTDSQGNFCLSPAPTGTFFALIDGRTTTSDVPAGGYYPFVGKPWTTTAGRTADIGTVYLPLVAAGTLQPVSSSQATTVTFPAAVVAANPAYAGVRLTVPADSLYSDDGGRGGKVGIAPVAPDRLPGPLPRGVDPALVITVQTDGPSNFDRPVPACFPNLPDPSGGAALPAGAKSSLVSYDHDDGTWKVVGPGTVSADGKLVCTDPGVGILKPSWHYFSPVATTIGGGARDPNGCPPQSQPSLDSANDKVRAGLGEFNPATYAGFGYLKGEGGTRTNLVTAAQVLNGVDKVRIPPTNSQEAVQNAEWLASAIGVLSTSVGLASPYGFLVGPFVEIQKAILEMYNYINSALNCAFRSLSPVPADPRSSADQAAQKEFLEARNAFATTLLGKPQLGAAKAKDLPALNSLYDGLASAVDPAGPSGRAIAPSERATLRGGDLPAGLAPADVDDIVDRLNGWLDPPASPVSPPGGSEIRDSGRRLAGSLTPIVDGGWQTAVDVVKDEFVHLSTLQGYAPVQSGVQPAIAQYYRVTSNQTGYSQRGRTNLDGSIPALQLPGNQLFLMEYVRPDTGAYGYGYFRSGPVASRTQIPQVFFLDNLPDGDGDGLPDLGEAVVGTSAVKADTDGDGVNDGAELRNGTDPLDGLPAATGVVASADTPGTAVAVDAFDDLVAVADDSAGLSLYNVFDGMAPALLARVDTPGAARDVSIAGNRVVLADSERGLAVVDITDPSAARIARQVDVGGPVDRVVAQSDLAYTALGSSVLVVDLVTGVVVEREDLGQRVDDLALADGLVYVATAGSLFVLDPQGGLTRRGSVALPSISGGRRALSVGGGYAFVGIPTGARPGHAVLDVRDPAAPAVVGQPAAAQGGVSGLAATGSGRLIATARFSNTTTGGDVAVYDAATPTDVSGLQAVLPTPGDAQGLSIFNGLAYVADGTAGLQVVNYLSYDALGRAPRLSLDTPSTVEESQPFLVRATVSDDVQVRSVDVFVDGVKVATDGNFPFEVPVTAPALAGGSSISVTATATDTGGNAATSAPSVVRLTADATPPAVRRTVPGAGRVFGASGVSTVSVTLSENLVGVGADDLTLVGAGANGVLGDADDTPVTSGAFGYTAQLRTLGLTFAQPLPAGTYRATLGTGIADASGNRPAQPRSWDFRVVNGTLLPGGSLAFAGTLDAPGVQDRFSFSGTVGQRVFVQRTAGTIGHRLDLTGPFSAPVFADETLIADPGGFTLPATGTYTLTARGSGTTTGAYGAMLWDVPAPQEFSYTLGTPIAAGAPAAGAGVLESPGVEDRYAFSGTVGQRVVVQRTAGTIGHRVDLTGPYGTPVFTDQNLLSDPGPFTLPATGSYTLTVRGSSSTTGGYGLVVWPAPAAQEFAYTLGSTISADTPGPGAGVLESPGAQDRYTFSGTVGQRVFVQRTAGTIGHRLDLTGPFDVPVFTDETLLLDPGAFTLPGTGTYTLTARGSSSTTGAYGFAVRAMRAPQDFTIAVGDTVRADAPAAGAGRLETPDAVDRYGFTAPAGTVVTVSSTDCARSFSLADPAGDVIAGGLLCRSNAAVLATGGRYTIDVFGSSGSYTFTLAAPPADTSTIALGDAVTGNVQAAGALDVYSFDATAGQRVLLDRTSGDSLAHQVSIVGPGGAVAASASPWSGDLAAVALPTTGRYTMTVGGWQAASTGSYGFRLWLVPAADTSAIALGDAVGGNLESPGAVDVYTVEATAGQRVVLNRTSGDSLTHKVSITAPGGAIVLAANPWSGDPPGLALPPSGRYTITVSGWQPASTGPYGFRLWSVPAPDTAAIALGDAVSGNLELPGAVDVYTVEATAGQRVVLDRTSGDGLAHKVSIAGPGGAIAGSASPWSADVGPLVLPQAGRYTITVSGWQPASTGPYAFTLRPE